MGGLLAEAMGAGLPGIERTIEDITRDVLREKARIGNSIVSIGRSLIEAKAMLPHGEWLPWLREQAGFSERSAQQYMQVAADPQLSRNPKLVSHLGLSKSMKICALPEAEKSDLVNATQEVDLGDERVRGMVVAKLEQRTQKRASEPEEVIVTPTRWENLVAGGVDAMARLLEDVRSSPEQFQQSFTVWLCDRVVDPPPPGR